MIMKEAFLLRESLVPYIYSNARHAYDEGSYTNHFIAMKKLNCVYSCRVELAATNVL